MITAQSIVSLHLPNLFSQITFSCSSLDSINHVQWHPGALMPQRKQQTRNTKHKKERNFYLNSCSCVCWAVVVGLLATETIFNYDMEKPTC